MEGSIEGRGRQVRRGPVSAAPSSTYAHTSMRRGWDSPAAAAASLRWRDARVGDEKSGQRRSDARVGDEKGGQRRMCISGRYPSMLASMATGCVCPSSYLVPAMTRAHEWEQERQMCQSAFFESGIPMMIWLTPCEGLASGNDDSSSHSPRHPPFYPSVYTT